MAALYEAAIRYPTPSGSDKLRPSTHPPTATLSSLLSLAVENQVLRLVQTKLAAHFIRYDRRLAVMAPSIPLAIQDQVNDNTRLW